MLNQTTLVLERVTLAKMIQLMIQMLVDLPSSTVFGQQTAKDTQTTHP